MPLHIVAVEGETPWEPKWIRIEVETWDPSADAPVPPSADGLAVSIDGAWMPGTFTVENAAARGEQIALGVVVADDDHIAALRAAIACSSPARNSPAVV